MTAFFLRWRQKRFLSSAWFEGLKVLLLAGGIAWFLARGSLRLSYPWQWYRVPRYLVHVKAGQWVAGPLLQGLWVTLEISGISLVLAAGIGLVSALLRLSNSLVGRWVARVYVEALRSAPLLVELFFIYFVLGPVLDLQRFTAAVLALSLFEGAYASEIIRSGINSIPQGQWEAAIGSGLSGADIYRFVILPQAIRRILPPLASQAVSLVKDSALVSTIAIYDLTMQGQAIIAETFLTFEIWFTVAAIYLVITLALSALIGLMQRRLSIDS
jgi:polar amino acid transport system permease protein